MRYSEIITETTEEDRALISLSRPIFSRIQDFSVIPLEKGKVFNVGKIGDLFDTPINILDPVLISIWTNEDIIEDYVDEDKQSEYLSDDAKRHVYGLWDANLNTIILNYDYIASNSIKSVITHELRHALDDYKSEFRANRSKKYSTPKNKMHRRDYGDDPYVDPALKARPYLARPAEINARFAEVLHGITSQVQHAGKKVDPSGLRDRVIWSLDKLMDQRHIKELFPEKEKSRAYKRLMKRAVDFVDKEIAYYKSQNNL